MKVFGLRFTTFFALACAPLWLGCPDSIGGGNGGSAPQVVVLVPDTNVVGTQLGVNVQVSNCSDIQSAGLYHDTRLLQTLTFNGASASVTLSASDIPFATAGLAAELALVARVTCGNGRQGQSAITGATFLPVAQTYSPTNGERIAPLVFYAESSGPSTTFVGCEILEDGTQRLVRRNLSGVRIAYMNTSQVYCTTATRFGPLQNGVRWMVTPQVGALAFNQQLEATVIARHFDGSSFGTLIVPPPRAHFTVASNGDLIIYQVPGVVASARTLYRVRPICIAPTCTDPVVWATTPQLGSASPLVVQLQGDPVIAGGSLLVPGATDDMSNSRLLVLTMELDVSTGQRLNFGVQGSIPKGPGDNPQPPPMTVSADGLRVFLRDLNPPGPFGQTSLVRAFETLADEVQVWQSDDFAAVIDHVTPFANGTRLAAVAANRTWFLDANTGNVLNPTTPATASGGSLTLYEIPGPNSELYMLSVPNGGVVGTPATELIAVQSAETGVFLQYKAGADTTWIAWDDGGQLWLRSGADVARPLTTSQYVALKNQQ
ncbi:MAG: hypothetical protein ACKVPX_08425 [Myxococcaceae bacterium]